MKISTKALKTINSILAVFVFVLFFLFLFTYDFTPKRSYRFEDDEFSLREKAEEAIRETSDLNFLNFEIDGDELTRAFYSLLNGSGNENLYESRIWTIKGMGIGIIRNKIALNIHATYHDNFKYNLKIRAFLSFEKIDDSYYLRIESLNFGALRIPKRNVRKILSNNDEGSIGKLVMEALNVIPFGKFNAPELEYVISLSDVVQAIEKKEFLNSFNEKYPNIRYLLMTYIQEVFRRGLATIELEDKLRIKFDYSNLINIVDEYELEDLEYSRSEVLGVAFRHLMLIDDIYLSEDDMKNILRIKLDSIKGDEFVHLSNTNAYIYDDSIHLVLSFDVYEKKSTIDFLFRKNGIYYTLSKCEIGRDDNEKESNYITIESSDSLTLLLKFLSNTGIKLTSLTRRLDLMTFVNGSNIKFDSCHIDDSNIYVSIEGNEIYRNALNYIIKSEEFKAYIGDINELIDYSDDDSLISSFMALDYQDKKKYFDFLKSFTKDETSLYNYIHNFLWEE